MTRSIEAMVDEQARRWQLVRNERREEAARPVVTVSRQHGAGGGHVARRLAGRFRVSEEAEAGAPEARPGGASRPRAHTARKGRPKP